MAKEKKYYNIGHLCLNDVYHFNQLMIDFYWSIKIIKLNFNPKIFYDINYVIFYPNLSTETIQSLNN